ncbi:hypothetical protein PIB30_022097 [Stylosanthes scabra]|uniref:Uncharacterized protein n=1 Tax=Stylosanthes scabra TaxID=79078 RepID=A0ABU6S9K3_9FABA|nr:hypothetical protein [Stylosanthes scabra]
MGLPSYSCLSSHGFEQRLFLLAERWIEYEPPRDREETRLRSWMRILNRLGISDQIVLPWVVKSEGTWNVVCPLPYFSIVQWHQVDHVVKHFGQSWKSASFILEI